MSTGGLTQPEWSPCRIVWQWQIGQLTLELPPPPPPHSIPEFPRESPSHDSAIFLISFEERDQHSQVLFPHLTNCEEEGKENEKSTGYIESFVLHVLLIFGPIKPFFPRIGETRIVGKKKGVSAGYRFEGAPHQAFKTGWCWLELQFPSFLADILQSE